MISLKLFQKDFFEKLRDHHLKTPDSFILMQYGLIEEQIKSKTVTKNLISHMKHPSSANLFKTKVIIRYTPEYIGHTVFYHFKKNPNHYFFNNITESIVDFTSVANPMNRTFGEHITLVKKENGSATVLTKNSLNITMFGIDLDKAKDKKAFHLKIKNILEFANSELDEQDYEFKRRYFWAKYEFDDETSELEFYSLNSTTLTFSIHVENTKKADFFNIAGLIIHFFNPKEYTVNKFESKDSFNYTKGDLVAYESGEFTFIHGAKVIDWVETKYQKVLVFDSTQLGVGMIIDSSILVLKNSKNYVDFYYSKVKELKPKKILIIGGADLSVLERIANSDLFADIEKIKVLDNDKEMMELSKKYLHPDFDKWMDEKKIEFLHIDADKYVQKAEGSNESYDLIIMTTSTPNEKGDSVEFGTKFFIRLNGYLLNTKGTILLHSGHVTEDGYYAEHKEKMPTFLPLFEHKTEAVFTPQFTGHLIVYVLTKKY
jgi:spermidine synthase